MPEAALETVRDFRRAQILEVAREIVATEGLDRLTFGALERRLAFTRGVITYHFKNKDDIVHALLVDTLDIIYDQAVEAVRGAQGPEQAVEAVIRAMVHGFLAHRDATHVLVSFWGRLQSDERARNLNAELYRFYRKRASAIVHDGQARGLFRSEADPEAAGAVIVAAVIGIAAQILFEGGSIDVDAAVHTAGQSLASWLAV